MGEVVQTVIDNKHHAELRHDATGKPYIAVVKTGNGQEIDLKKEPVILFRGRDKLALLMLNHYHQLCVDDGCTAYQLKSMDGMIDRFASFAEESPTMKQPGSTLGK